MISCFFTMGQSDVKSSYHAEAESRQAIILGCANHRATHQDSRYHAGQVGNKSFICTLPESVVDLPRDFLWIGVFWCPLSHPQPIKTLLAKWMYLQSGEMHYGFGLCHLGGSISESMTSVKDSLMRKPLPTSETALCCFSTRGVESSVSWNDTAMDRSAAHRRGGPRFSPRGSRYLYNNASQKRHCDVQKRILLHLPSTERRRRR